MPGKTDNNATIKPVITALKPLKPFTNSTLAFFIVGILLEATPADPITITQIYGTLQSWGYTFARSTVWHALQNFPPEEFSNLILKYKTVRAGDSRAKGYWIEFNR